MLNKAFTMHHQRRAFLAVAGNKWTTYQCNSDRDLESSGSVTGALPSPWLWEKHAHKKSNHQKKQPNETNSFFMWRDKKEDCIVLWVTLIAYSYGNRSEEIRWKFSDWKELVQDTVEWHAVVKTVKDHLESMKGFIFMIAELKWSSGSGLWPW